MMIESTRRRVLDTLNSRYLYGRVVRSFLEHYDFIKWILYISTWLPSFSYYIRLLDDTDRL